MLSSRSEVIPIDPADVPIFVSSLDVSLYCQIAIVTVLIYDTFSLLCKLKVKFFWSSPRSFVSLIYFFNRYVGLFSAIIRLDSNFELWAAYITDWMTILFVDCGRILLFRSLYTNLHVLGKKLARCLQTLFVMEAAFMLWIVIHVTSGNKSKFKFYVARFSPTTEMFTAAIGGLAKGINICVTVSLAPGVWRTLFWVAPVAFELILMVLALRKAAAFWRASAGFRGFGLAKMLVQDQALYFILVISCSVSRILGFEFVNNTVLSTVFGEIGSASFLCVLGSRLLVHLKEAGERGFNGGTSYSSWAGTMSNLEFA
ncbi:hypothetical protein DFH11DRAFT_1609637 [Phellopilus nigrolimitatus]|nr:hypothetical protein DFH11DRAFT_1609637 [Phellopilus nigrolimitatus]